MDRIFLMLGSALGFLGVAAGAFGAHGLREKLSPDLLEIYETAVHYHLVHALALLATAWVAARTDTAVARAAGWLFVAGILIFSGSLYVLSMTGLRWMGAVTPLGGLAFLAGWASLFWASMRLP